MNQLRPVRQKNIDNKRNVEFWSERLVRIINFNLKLHLHVGLLAQFNAQSAILPQEVQLIRLLEEIIVND